MRYDALMTPVCPRTTPKIGELMPPPAAQKAMRLLFGTLRLGFLLKNNPFLEKEAAANAAIRRLYIAAEHERQPRHERAALPA